MQLCIRDAGFWTEHWWHAGRSPSSLARRTRHPWFPTRMSNLDSSDHRTLFHFETVHFKLSLGPQDTMALLDHVHIWLPFCMIALYLASADGTADCVYDSGFWRYSWAHLVMSMTESCRWVMQCRLRAQRLRASNKGLRPCPLRTEISPVSLNLLMMLYTVDDEIRKAFAIWRSGTMFLKDSTIFLRTLSQIGEPLLIFTSERLCLSKTSLL